MFVYIYILSLFTIKHKYLKYYDFIQKTKFFYIIILNDKYG